MRAPLVARPGRNHRRGSETPDLAHSPDGTHEAEPGRRTAHRPAHAHPLYQARHCARAEGTVRRQHYAADIAQQKRDRRRGHEKSDSLPLGVVGPCHIFGEIDLLDGEPRSATCRAHTDMPVAVLTKINRPFLEQKIAGMDTHGHPERCCRPGQFLDVLIAGVWQG